MPRYLKQEEKEKTRKLWKEAFPEDSDSFLDYYYEEKMKDNQVIVVEEQEKILSMAHLNPYRVSVRGRLLKSNYIVAVATDAAHRHQGHMRAVLNQILNDMCREKMAFTFLMPADKDIYLPFDFVYIFDQPKWELKEEVKGQVASRACPAEFYYYQETADFMNSFLAPKYQVYSLRDAAYVERLQKELQSENGELEILYDKCDERRLVGVRAYWGLKEREERMFYACPEYGKLSESRKPAIMARITNLEEFMKSIRLVKEAPVEELTIELQVRDPLIADNNGRFSWKLDKKSSEIRRMDDKSWYVPEMLSAADVESSEKPDMINPQQKLNISIGQLTGWLFGYSDPEEKNSWGSYEESGKNHSVYEMIDTLKGVYLDEIV